MPDADLSQVERAALHAWNLGPQDTAGMLAAVRAALAVMDGADDARLTIAMETVSRLRDELAAIRDIAYRASTAGAGDALEEIRKRAARAASQGG